MEKYLTPGVSVQLPGPGVRCRGPEPRPGRLRQRPRPRPGRRPVPGGGGRHPAGVRRGQQVRHVALDTWQGYTWLMLVITQEELQRGPAAARAPARGPRDGRG